MRKSTSIRRSDKMKRWRRIVRRRDDYTCQLCHKRKSKVNKIKLHVHHIVRFVDNVAKRCDPSNGIVLCQFCHRLTYRKEKDFEDRFNKIVADKKIERNEIKKKYKKVKKIE
jgi:5-methylcytosine-specific restriction endonuclease McrA